MVFVDFGFAVIDFYFSIIPLQLQYFMDKVVKIELCVWNTSISCVSKLSKLTQKKKVTYNGFLFTLIDLIWKNIVIFTCDDILSFQERSSPANLVRKRLANGESSPPPRSSSVDKKIKKEPSGRDSVDRTLSREEREARDARSAEPRDRERALAEQESRERGQSPVPYIGKHKVRWIIYSYRWKFRRKKNILPGKWFYIF